jgi:hypothetical protein
MKRKAEESFRTTAMLVFPILQNIIFAKAAYFSKVCYDTSSQGCK